MDSGWSQSADAVYRGAGLVFFDIAIPVHTAVEPVGYHVGGDARFSAGGLADRVVVVVVTVGFVVIVVVVVLFLVYGDADIIRMWDVMAAVNCVALVVGELLWLVDACGFVCVVVVAGVVCEWWHFLVAGIIVMLVVCGCGSRVWVSCADAYGVVGEVVCAEEVLAVLEVVDRAFRGVLRVVVGCMGIGFVVVSDGVFSDDVG